MSLELALQQNTAALNTLIALLSNPAVVVNQGPVNIEGGAQVGAPAESTKTTRAKPTKPTAEKVEAKKAEVEKAEETKAEPLTYEATAAWVVKVGAKLGKAGVTQVLGQFGAEKNLKEVDPSQWAAVIVACQELLG
ncbi:hypothetical protein UFOVP143_23 [uncultured Caudovirales phage]|uniref:Uncharacterized protein n=1 Tax=uncultured Caudovirales phage TaxID=2100421 RepID=A0A6J7VPB6_9CAUD|nr:hypothetical protein UFOVP143_23 [uncultured Caudovirales phage]